MTSSAETCTKTLPSSKSNRIISYRIRLFGSYSAIIAISSASFIVFIDLIAEAILQIFHEK